MTTNQTEDLSEPRRSEAGQSTASWRRGRATWRPAGGSPEFVFLLGVFLVNLLLVAPDLMVGFTSINPYDEAKYIDSGRSLLAGDLRQLSWGPLVALVYAPFAPLRQLSADGFLLSAWAGRFTLYVLLWWSTLTLAKRFRPDVHPFLVAGVLFASLHFFPLLENSSDAAFAVCSALALAKLLDFRESHRLTDAAAGSALCGLAMLARVEAVLLLATYAALCSLLALRRVPLSRVLSACILPAAGLIGVYLAVSWLSMGHIDLGMGSKSYDSFEVNQPLASGIDRAASRQETRRLFGTPDENQHSVLRAILHNPSAFLQRVAIRALGLPRQFLEMNGKRLGAMMGFFAAWGLYALLRRRNWRFAVILMAWALPSAVALAFLPRHFLLQTSYLVVILAALGAAYALEPGQSGARRWAGLCGVAVLLLLGWIGHLDAIFAAGLLVGACLVLAWCLGNLASPEIAKPSGLLLLLMTGLLLRGAYPFPDFPRPGTTPEERAVHQMQRIFPPGARIAVSVPLPAIAAGMRPIDLDLPQDAPSFEAWLASSRIDGVYIGAGASDSALRSTILESIDVSLKVEYQENGTLVLRTMFATPYPAEP